LLTAVGIAPRAFKARLPLSNTSPRLINNSSNNSSLLLSTDHDDYRMQLPAHMPFEVPTRQHALPVVK
jgi:hypothetical protein